MAAGRLPLSGAPLASQPPISRFLNRPSRAQLYRMATCIAGQFIASYDEDPALIVLDFDDTDSQTYGRQQLTLFNAYYNGYCYMPLHVYEGISGKLITTILKPTVMKGPGVALGPSAHRQAVTPRMAPPTCRPPGRPPVS